MILKEGGKYKVVVARSEGHFTHHFNEGTIVEYTGVYKDHYSVGMIYQFKGKGITNWLKKFWVIPVNNSIKKLG